MTSSRKRMILQSKRALRHMLPNHIVKSRMTRKAFEAISEKVGLVYFGGVSRHDEHKLVRGHTVSATHLDDHYSVGTIDGYDCMLVLRNDILTHPLKAHVETRCHWLICAIELKTQYEIPHMYIGHTSRDEMFKASYEQLPPLNIIGYSQKFTDYYTIYAKAMYGADIADIIDPQMAETIVTHFSSASIEIEDNTMYLYIESKHPSEVLIEKMLSNGLWLAKAIDAKTTNPYEA